MTNEVATKPDSKTLAMMETVRKTVFSNATDPELALFFHRCNVVGVNPLDGLIHPTKYQQKDGTSKVTFISSINLLRSKSDETGLYDGMDEPEYGDEIEQEYQEDVYENGKKVGNETKIIMVPEWASVKIYRKDIGRPFVAKARWKEYYPGQLKGHQWRMRPYLMLAKCAEALARRLAFPDKLNQLYTEEEMVRATEELAGVETRTSTKPNVTPDQVKPRAQTTPEEATGGKRYKGIIQSVKPKNGKIPGFVKIGNKDYSTFSDTHIEIAQSLVGKMASFTFVEKGKYINLDSIEPVVEVQATQAAPNVQDSAMFLDGIRTLLAERFISEEEANETLQAELGFTLESIPAEMQPKVLEILGAR